MLALNAWAGQTEAELYDLWAWDWEEKGEEIHRVGRESIERRDTIPEKNTEQSGVAAHVKELEGCDLKQSRYNTEFSKL